MSDEANPLSDQKIKHLDMIQGIITRMASESSSMKRYALAAAAAVNSTAAGTDTWYLALAGAALTGVFWLMDAQYLSQERQFRSLYDTVRKPETPADFSLKLSPAIRAQHPISKAMFGWSVGWLYGCLMILSLIIAWVTAGVSMTS